MFEVCAGKQACAHSAGAAAFAPALSAPANAQGSVKSVSGSTAAFFKASCWGWPPWLLQASCAVGKLNGTDRQATRALSLSSGQVSGLFAGLAEALPAFQVQLCMQSPLTYKLIVLEGAPICDRRYLQAEEGFYDLQQAVGQVTAALLCKVGRSSACAGLERKLCSSRCLPHPCQQWQHLPPPFLFWSVPVLLGAPLGRHAVETSWSPSCGQLAAVQLFRQMACRNEVAHASYSQPQGHCSSPSSTTQASSPRAAHGLQHLRLGVSDHCWVPQCKCKPLQCAHCSGLLTSCGSCRPSSSSTSRCAVGRESSPADTAQHPRKLAKITDSRADASMGCALCGMPSRH